MTRPPPGDHSPYADMQAGFLTYDLQEFTADCLSRAARVLPCRLKAYPTLELAAIDRIDFDYRPSRKKGGFFTVRRKGSTPEGFSSTLNWGAAWACARESDVVVFFGLQGATALAAAVLGTLLRRRMVSVNQTLPPYWERKRRWWVRWLKGWLLRRCRVHVLQTPLSRDTLRQVYGIDEALCVEAPFEAGAGVFQEHLARVPQTRRELRRGFGWGDRECVFLYVGALFRFKGVETILEAGSLLQKKASSFRMVFIGPEHTSAGEPSIDDYRKQAQALGIGERTQFRPREPLAELARVYKAADALLLPTQKDVWPKVLVEGALAGLPLVTTTACGAAGGLVIAGRTGFVIPPDDPPALAEAMEKLLDPGVRRSLGAEAREVELALCDRRKEAQGYREAVLKALETR